jgi:glycosyltransferase involved in cell wall biosynthesis
LDDYLEDPDDVDAVVQSTAGAPYILFMGRLNLIKGPDLLLEAFASVHQKMPHLHLVFAGPDGGSLNELRSRVSTLALEKRVHFVGFLSGRSKVGAYRRATALVIPSRSEAMSIVVLEAGACGLPVVLTDQCGFNEVQTIGGGIVSCVSADSIAEAILLLISMDVRELRSMGEKLRSFAISNYSWRSVIDKYIVVYNRVLETSKVVL